MHLLHALSRLLGAGVPGLGRDTLKGIPQKAGSPEPRPMPGHFLSHAAALSPLDPGRYGYLPDTTFNPNPRTNIPWSSHNLSLVKLLHQIESNPDLQGARYIPNDLSNPTGLGAQVNYRALLNQFGNTPNLQQPSNYPLQGTRY